MIRSILNRVGLGVVAIGTPLALGITPELGPQDAFAQGGGTCCDEVSATCYINLDGVIIRQEGASYSPGSCGS